MRRPHGRSWSGPASIWAANDRRVFGAVSPRGRCSQCVEPGEVYIQAFQTKEAPSVTGERYLVLRAGALALRWRRDGRELFYLGFDGRVQAVPVKLSPKPDFGAATALFTISTEARAAIHSVLGFDVSADGQRFVIPVVSPGGGPSIVVVHNWESLLPHQR